MPVSPDAVRPGDVLYDVHREKLAHVRASRLACFTVKVIEVDREAAPYCR